MFGFRGGEAAETVARKRDYMKDIQSHWSFLTNYDLSTIKNEEQLVSMVKDRSGMSLENATASVGAWMTGKSF